MPARGISLDITVDGVDQARKQLRRLGEDSDAALRRPAEGASNNLPRL